MSTQKIYLIRYIGGKEYMFREKGTTSATIVMEGQPTNTDAENEAIKAYKEDIQTHRREKAVKIVTAPITGAKFLLKGLGVIAGTIGKAFGDGYEAAQPFEHKV